MKTLNSYILLLAFMTVALLTACHESKDVPFLQSNGDVAIDNIIKQGWLLKTVEKKSNWKFCFEEGEVEFPIEEIVEVKTDLSSWNTTIVYRNGKMQDVPTLGNMIDDMVAYVEVNPSGFNPLAAQVRMNFPQGGTVRTIVHSKDGCKHPDIEHNNAFDSQKVQIITILGLYADYINKVELVYSDKKGRERCRTWIDIKVDKLDMDYPPVINVLTAQVDKMEPGLNLVNSPGHDEDDTSRPYMVDADGEIRWLLDWRKSKDLLHIGAQCGLHRLSNGNFVTGDFNNNQLVEVDLLGNLIHKWNLTEMGYVFHHEAREVANGNYWVTVTKRGAMHLDGKTPRILDFIIELNPETGSVVKEWDFSTILDTTRIIKMNDQNPGAQQYGQSKTNWLHNNGVAEFEDDMVITGRWQGIFGCHKDGRLKWIIAPHNNWSDEYKPYLLQPLDRNGQPIMDEDVLDGIKEHPDFEWSWGVHCPNVLPNGHILVFDNGYARNFIPRLQNDENSYSRAVEYEIDLEKKTVRQVWQYGKERERDCYASAISGVDFLPLTGHRMFCPGQDNRLSNGDVGGRVIEIDTQGTVIFELEIGTNTCASAFHRVNRMSLYPDNQ